MNIYGSRPSTENPVGVGASAPAPGAVGGAEGSRLSS